MSIELTVSGDVYEYPENREAPGWGEASSAWAVAVTAVLANVSGSGDVLQTSAVISNNVSSPTNIIGFSFDPTIVRGAVCEYSIYRKTDTTASERSETGMIFLSYLTQNTAWNMVVVGGGLADVTLSVTSAGQVQYTSTNLAGTNYSGTIKFRARSLTA